jgi:hypothetical protein
VLGVTYSSPVYMHAAISSGDQTLSLTPRKINGLRRS